MRRVVVGHPDTLSPVTEMLAHISFPDAEVKRNSWVPTGTLFICDLDAIESPRFPFPLLPGGYSS